MMNGDATIEVKLVEVVLLECNERPGRRIRSKVSGVAAGHSSHRRDRVRREDVLVGDAPHGFIIVAILQLPPGNVYAIGWFLVHGNGWTAGVVVRVWQPCPVLLYQFVGNRIAREFMAENNGKTVLLRYIPLITSREAGSG